MKPKVVIIGYARHGKDTVAEMLATHHGFTYASSSLFAAEHVVKPYLARHHRLVYPSLQACYDDRSNHRSQWHDAISEYTRKDPARLARAVFAEHDIYVGMRNNTEFNCCRNEGLFDCVVWVDRGNVLPMEDFSSMKLAPWMADFILDNNGTAKELKRNLDMLAYYRLKERLWTRP